MRVNGSSALHTVKAKGCPPSSGSRGKSRADDGDTRKGPSSLVERASWFDEQEVVVYRRELLNWYDCNHRVLPWRRTPHSKKEVVTSAGGEEQAVSSAPSDLPQQQFAYWVWVSEVMLQQTQVATVMPYFKRWVAKWPTVADLAAADIDTVNALWAGLGYYRRARYLLDGARYVVERLDGQFPTSAPELLKIPGVGPYTSAAVASIAFGSPAAAVDGNVVRVVSRLRALPGDPTKLAATHAAMASELLDRDRPGCYNQALMELGATVCRPINPNCPGCPVRSVCRAAIEWESYLAAGGVPDMEDAPRVTQYPGRKAVKEKREQAVAVTVLEVICASQHPQTAGIGVPAAGASAVKKALMDAAAAETAQPPRKRQRTMQDFALAAAARKQQHSAGGAEAAAAAAGDRVTQGSEAGGACGGVDLEALVARGTRHFLLTMRPQGGLLAGLWEFPGALLQGETRSEQNADNDGSEEEEKPGGDTTAPAATSAAERQRVSDALLTQLLGPHVGLSKPGAAAGDAVPPLPAAAAPLGAAANPPDGAGELKDTAAPPPPPPHMLRVLARHDMGRYVHVFSHIRQTNCVQRITAVFHGDLATLQRLTGAAAGAAAAGDSSGGGELMRAGGEAVAKGTPGKDGSVQPGSSSAPKRGREGHGKKAGAAKGKGEGKPHDVEPAEEAEIAVAGPAIMWVNRQQIEGPGLGLSSGVRKIFQQAVGGAAEAAGAGRGRAAAAKGGGGGKGKGAGGKAAAGKAV